MLVAGCAPRIEYVRPSCEPAPLPNVDIDRGEMYDAVGEQWFWKIDGAFDRLIDWGLENEAILEEVCE